MPSTMTRSQEPRIVEYPMPSPARSVATHGARDSLSHFLGCFSIGLGLAEALAPRAMAQVTGGSRQGLLRLFGFREIVTGIGILNSTRPTGWLWARVAGDALDLIALASNLEHADVPQRERALASLLAVAGVTALDVYCATRR